MTNCKSNGVREKATIVFDPVKKFVTFFLNEACMHVICLVLSIDSYFCNNCYMCYFISLKGM
jgi:hypothetical protein